MTFLFNAIELFKFTFLKITFIFLQFIVSFLDWRKKKRDAWQFTFLEYTHVIPHIIYALGIMMTANDKLFNTIVPFLL